MSVDLSVIVTAHDETLVSGPTMTAADLAIKEAEAAGFSVERIIALDNATPETVAYFGQPAFDAWTRKVMTCGDLGRVRNALVPDVAGDAVAFLDADDLFSSNWLSEGMRRMRDAEAQGEKVIVHPELNWLFDGAQSVFWKPDQDDPMFLPQYFYFMNYYDSLCMVPRDAHLAVPYVSRDIPRGLSFQDWQFSIESMAAGWKHVAAPNTIIFKRRRDESLVTESRARKALVRPLAPMRIDRVSALSHVQKPEPTASKISSAPEATAAVTQKKGATSDAEGLSGLFRRFFGRAAPDPTPVVVAPQPEPEPVAPPPQPVEQTPIELDVPHYGAVMADRIALAVSRQGADKRSREVMANPAYPIVAPEVDIAYYLVRYPDLARALRLDVVAHFVRAGAKEKRDPSPVFSTKEYLEMYPDVAETQENAFAHYLTTGKAEGRVAPPVPRFEILAKAMGLTMQEAEAAYTSRYRDIRQRLEYGELGRQANLAAEIEPLISLGWPEALQVKIPPLHTSLVSLRLGIFLELLEKAGNRPTRFIICVNRARFGGALRLEGQVAQALASGCPADEIVVLITDQPGFLPENRLPEGVRQVDLAAAVADLKEPQRERVLAEFLRALAPECVFNVNSRMLWQCLTTYGDALSSGTKLVAALFCAEQSMFGHWTGYPYKRAYRHFDQLHGLVTDSHALAAELRQQYSFPDHVTSRLVTWDAPVDMSIPLVAPKAEAKERPQVFWSGRYDRQKRIDFVLDIAAAMPEVDFHLWGAPVMDRQNPKPKSANVTLHDPYLSFKDLPLEEADLWLYTSGWDGVPQTLLEVGVSGLPVIASDVGGTREAALPEHATLMPADAPLDAWVQAIKDMLSDLPAARARAEKLREALRETRTREAYAEQVWGLLNTIHPPLAPEPAPELEDNASAEPAATDAENAAKPGDATDPKPQEMPDAPAPTAELPKVQ